jgi:ribosomal protein L32
MVNLWADSEDLPLTGKRHISKKDPIWSYKTNSPGRRYILFADGRGRIRILWGGYTLKLFDGNFLEIQKGWQEKKFKGAGVIADHHFDWGKQNLKKVKFVVPFKKEAKRKRRGRRQEEKPKQAQLTSKGIEEWNKKVHHVCARVENRFGVMYQNFQALTKPWPESENQLDHLVFIAAGVINSSLG